VGGVEGFVASELLAVLIISITLILIGKVLGARAERAHFARIAERETRFRSQPALSSKHVEAPIRSAALVTGSVVVSVDHFKRFVGAVRMLVGGEVRSYSTVIERARREAILRMKESQPDADAYINTRLETSTVGTAAGNEGMGTVEVLAYGTAVHYDRDP
jgi:uncharacterized protein YbjQ (UPF0145 family)